MYFTGDLEFGQTTRAMRPQGPLRPLAIVLIALTFVPIGRADNPTSGPSLPGAAVVVTNPVPGWLSSVAKTFQIDFEQENVGASNRLESAALVESILTELLYANCTIYLSSRFLNAELAYYRAHLQDEPARSVAEGVLQALEDAARSSQLDWARLDELRVRAPNSDVVMRHLPWLNVTPGKGRLKIASETQTGLPSLTVKVGWFGRPTRGIVVSSSTSRDYGPPRSGPSGSH